MKSYEKLCKLTDELLKAETPEAKIIAEEKLRKFRSYENYPSTKPDVEDAVNVLSDAVNGRNNSELFVKEMNRQHRTLQQGMTRLFLEWFNYLSKLDEGYYDGRNEQSVKVAKNIMSWLKFTDELERYHSFGLENENPSIKYMEEHKKN